VDHKSVMDPNTPEGKPKGKPKGKSKGKKLLYKLGTSINPWFRYYSTPGLWGAFVACIMAVGVFLIFVDNLKCTSVSTV